VPAHEWGSQQRSQPPSPTTNAVSRARIGSQPTASGASISNETGPALHADGLQVGSELFLRDRFNAAGEGELGAVRILDARRRLTRKLRRDHQQRNGPCPVGRPPPSRPQPRSQRSVRCYRSVCSFGHGKRPSHYESIHPPRAVTVTAAQLWPGQCTLLRPKTKRGKSERD
jgi:hypothetical protein